MDADEYQNRKHNDEDWGDPLAPGETKPLATMISIRLTAEEADLIRQAATNADSTLSAFVRQAALAKAHDDRGDVVINGSSTVGPVTGNLATSTSTGSGLKGPVISPIA